jgi:hypothetical protein
VEQELIILPEHHSFWAIKKLCCFSWTFPQKFKAARWFLFLYDVRDTDRNQDQGNIPSSRHQRDQKDQRGLMNLKITHKRAGNKKGYRMVLNGNIKGYQRTRSSRAFFIFI